MKKKMIEVSTMVQRHKHLFLLIVTTAMFILAAGAPNATVGIGK